MGKQSRGSTTTSSSDPSDSKHEQKLQAILFADSFTSTFRPISLDTQTPKVLCPLNNVRMLDYSIEFLAGSGVEELFVYCVHGADEVERYVTQSTWTSSIKVTCVKDRSCLNMGDALRDLDKRNLIQSDPFILMSGDVITNVDIVPALEAHRKRRKMDSSAIMTMLLKRVGGWDVTSSDKNATSYGASPIRSTNDDLLLGISQTSVGNRILLYDDTPNQNTASLPCSFFTTHTNIELRSDMLDVGIDICSPDVLARFSDEFDYRHLRRQFVHNSVSEEEEGLQNKIYAHVLANNEYAARIHDYRTYDAVSKDMLRRWCYPVVPDNLPCGYEKEYRYVLQRSFWYRECKEGGTKIGRSSSCKGPGMVGSGCWIGEGCTIEGTVIGNNCHISSNTTLKQSHLWQNTTIEENVTIVQSILCNDVVIKKGARIGKGCIIGRGCVVGTDVVLPEFTRLTLCKDEDEGEDEFGDFGEDDDGGDDDWSTSDEDDEEEEDEDAEGVGEKATTTTTADTPETDHDIVGKDGLGRVWLPPAVDDDDDDDSDDDSEDDDEEGGTKAQRRAMEAIETMKAQSIGFDPTQLYQKRWDIQEEDDDGMSDDDDFAGGSFDDDDDEEGMYGMGGDGGEDWLDTSETGGGAPSGSNVVGRQKGIDVVKELKLLCLEHSETSPVENLAIELNSFKFSQNATYGDCAVGAILAVLERMNVNDESMSAGKLVSALKEKLKHWGPLLQKLCQGMEEEKRVLIAIESCAVGGSNAGGGGSDVVIGKVLSREPAFRFMLQTLHDEEVLSEEAILSWATERKEGDLESARGKLFMQKPTQDFLDWLQEESESDDDSDDEDDDSDEE